MTEVSCHLILGLRHSYDDMYSETSYLIIWGMNFAPHRTRLASTARYGTFFTYFFLILTPVNHLLEFQYSRHANYSLIIQKYQKQVMQELVVSVPLCSVLVPNQFWRAVPLSLWVVLVLFCHCIRGTGTTPKGYRYWSPILPRNGRIHHFSCTFLL